jgi:hypothetical protein
MMNIEDDIPICQELGIDSDLVPFLGKDRVSLPEVRCYHFWRRGFGVSDIECYFGISTKDAESYIAHIQKIVPREMLDRDSDVRNEILAIKIQSAERERRLQELSSKSANDFMQEGRNPARILQEIREMGSEDFHEIEDLRAKDAGSPTDEMAEDHALKEDLKCIAKLQKSEDETSANKQTSGKAKQSSNSGNCKTDRREQKRRRITLRLEGSVLKRLEEHLQRSGLDLSKAVRNAIVEYLKIWAKG